MPGTQSNQSLSVQPGPLSELRLSGELTRAPGSVLNSLVKLCGQEFIRTVVTSCGGSRWKSYSWSTGQVPGKADEQLGWLNGDRFSAGPEVVKGPGSPEGTRPPALAAVLGPQENPGAALLSRRVARAPSPAGVCCTRGCTRKEMMPFC
uniref:Insulin-like 3 n=1 Tax=Chelydra serpentina TaxID=8475 RepID=A0A8C3S420_CHESE